MANSTTVSKSLGMMAIVLQDKKVTPEFVTIYQEMLNDLPDAVLFEACKVCIKTRRFFPTIAELRESAEPILQAYNLENLRLLENDIQAKCRENVRYIENTNGTDGVECLIDKDGGCEYAGGKCKRWDFLSDLRAEHAQGKTGGPF